MLVIREDDYNSLWAELQWPGEKFERVMSYFRKYAGLEEGLSSKRLTKLLLDLGKSCYTVRGGLESLTERGDLCWIISGTNIMSGSQFMCLAGLMDNSTPHSTNSPAGLLRLEMIFMYYDKGNKGYWDKNDWELIMKDIQYPSKNGEKLVPYPLKHDQFINFEMLKKLVETRRLRGTSQLLRISFDKKNTDSDKNENSIISVVNNSKNKTDCNISKNDTSNYVECKIKLVDDNIKTCDIKSSNYSPNSKKTLRVFSPKKKRQQKIQNEPSKSTFIESVSSYMSKIPAVQNSPAINNNSPRIMAFRSEVTPNPYFMVEAMNDLSNGGMMINNHNKWRNQSLLPIQHNYQTPIHLMSSQIPNNTDSDFISPVLKNVVGINDDSNNEVLNLNSLQNLGQSLQNIGQSLISMIPKVFTVPNITVSAGNYTYVSQTDLQNRMNNCSSNNNNNIDLKNEKVCHNSLDNVICDQEKVNYNNIIHYSEKDDKRSQAFSNINLPNFHSTYSNDNYPMSINLTRVREEDSTLLPVIPEIDAKLNPYIIGNEREIDTNKRVVVGKDCFINKDINSHSKNESITKDGFYGNLYESNINNNNSNNGDIRSSNSIRLEEIDYFLTFMEQLLYNEIMENNNIFKNVIEKHDSNFNLTDEENKYFGKIMIISTMDQLLLTFALSCIISHQNNYYNFDQAQNKGILGNGVTPDEINNEVNKLSDLFYRIYRIMYQDLKNEMERNCSNTVKDDNSDNKNNVDYTMYDDLPYVIKMVWEKIKTALQDDSDKEEIIKDICVVYYHYILETNESFSTNSETGDKIKYHSIDEMIEIVRQRYVIAMKMLSLNNKAKNNNVVKNLTKNQLGKVNIKDDKINVYFNNIDNNIKYNSSSYENVSSTCNSVQVDSNNKYNQKIMLTSPSPKYPLLTATSSPNYHIYKMNVGSLRTVGTSTKKLECDSSRKFFENSAEYGLSNDLVPCLSSENLFGKINSTNREPINKHDFNKTRDIGFYSGAISSSKSYTSINNKLQTNIASYCPAEHILTDKVPDARLERKSRIPSRIL
ncbi:hypothetical protein FG386_001885 [Cryptosporidium ryanae]|uniref:uncharacterized protein n=1 Tax=Cryptosporidium ryanae TaxID=515981 RepID=UPI003519F9BC|nr:hypothetical protein FG386_001885 [Cryptosporidium ryanae]